MANHYKQYTVTLDADYGSMREVASDPAYPDRRDLEHSATPPITQRNWEDYRPPFIERAALFTIAGESVQEGGGYFLPRNIFE